MKFVVDTNVLLSALIRNSTTRSIILNPDREFYVPEFAMEELAKYFPLVSSKSGLPLKEVKLLFDILALKLQVIPVEDFRKNYTKAERMMRAVDEKDVPFLALALSVDCDGIWSNDRHFKEQDLIKAWSTTEMVRVLRKT